MSIKNGECYTSCMKKNKYAKICEASIARNEIHREEKTVLQKQTSEYANDNL